MTFSTLSLQCSHNEENKSRCSCAVCCRSIS